MPLTFEFTPEEAILIEKYKEELKAFGIHLEHFGGKTYTVRSHPTWFPKGEEEQIIRDIVHQVIENEKIDLESLRDEVAALMACKRSIKANHHLSLKEMEQLSGRFAQNGRSVHLPSRETGHRPSIIL